VVRAILLFSELESIKLYNADIGYRSGTWLHHDIYTHFMTCDFNVRRRTQSDGNNSHGPTGLKKSLTVKILFLCLNWILIHVVFVCLGR
jgi:hypothetical protein